MLGSDKDRNGLAWPKHRVGSCWYGEQANDGIDDQAIAVTDMQDAIDEIALSHEFRREPGARLQIDALRTSSIRDMATAHHHQFIRNRYRLLLVVGDMNECGADFPLYPLQFALHLPAQLQVKRAQRLVQQQDIRLDRKSSGKSDALALAPGKLVRFLWCGVAQSDEVKHTQDALFAIARLDTTHAKSETNVVANTHVRKQCIILKNSRRRSPGRRYARHVAPIDHHAALVGE
jgi:hypothetical protein